MKKRIPRIIRPSMRLYFIILVVFAALTFFIDKGNHYLALGELGVIILLAVYTRIDTHRRAATFSKYIETVTDHIDSASQDSLSRTPLPVVIYNVNTGNILWANELFNTITGAKEHFFEITVTDIVPDYEGEWLLEGKTESPSTVNINDKRYKVYGTHFQTNTGFENGENIATTYWVDVTDYDTIRIEYERSRPVAVVIAIDSYEDILKNLNERDKSAILSDIDTCLTAWTNEMGGYLRRYDRDRYLYICEEHSAVQFTEDKFSVLEKIRELSGAGGARASLSIGVGRGAKTFEENMRYAHLALDMALSRGGDQAVIKNTLNFEFFGGNAAEAERRTKVKSRVMASALNALIDESDKIFIMGHRAADYDAVGAAVGICCIARAKGKPAYILLDRDERSRAVADRLVQHVKTLPEYAEVFISEEALNMGGNNNLLVVVDTSRPEEVQSREVLEASKRIAVIDHHRRAATYIENTALTFNEPYASSAAELVTEMMQYIVEQRDILKVEAEALLCGIVLDTKTFAIHTGSRTFEAAAFLRRLGADTVEIKALMQSDFEMAMQRYEIVRGARIYNEKAGIALAVSDKEESRVSVAQAADELLNISGVTCSFVAAPTGGGVVFISGRSIGQVNVQLILEKLGGGGNQSVAGAALKDCDAQTAAENLTRVIEEYLKDNKLEEIKK